MSMMKKIILVATLLFTMPAMACQINYADGLSDAEVQELKVLCEQMKAKALQTTPGSISEVVKSVDPTTIASIQAISVAIVDAVNGIAKGARCCS